MRKLFLLLFLASIPFCASASVTATTTWSFDNSTEFVYSVASITLNSSASLVLTGSVYDTNNPTIYPFRGVLVESLVAFTASSTATGPDAVKYDFLVDSTSYYFSTTWKEGSGTYSHTNTGAEVTTNIAALSLSASSHIVPRAWLHSTTGTGTPVLYNFSLSYVQGDTASADTCSLVGYVSLSDEKIPSFVTVKATPERDAWINGSNILVLSDVVTATPDATGYFSLDLIRSSQYERVIRYKVQIVKSNRVALSRIVTIPDQSAANLEDLVR